MTKLESLKGKPKTKLVDENGTLTKVFENVVNDIFRKFDLLIGRELNFDEFKVLYQCTGQELSEHTFKNALLS